MFYEDEATPFRPGPVNLLQERGRDVALFGNGILLPRLVAAADVLEGQGVKATLVEVHTVKPLDVDGVTRVLKRCGAAVTAEDHTINGGLGSAIMEAAAENAPVPIARIGLRDLFAGSGKPDDLLDKYGMSVADIVAAAMGVVARKDGRT